MGPLELAQLKELCAARSTNGCYPWFAKNDAGAGHAPYGAGKEPPHLGLWRLGPVTLAEDELSITMAHVEPFSDIDAHWIEVVWTAVPELIRSIEALRDEVERLRAVMAGG